MNGECINYPKNNAYRKWKVSRFQQEKQQPLTPANQKYAWCKVQLWQQKMGFYTLQKCCKPWGYGELPSSVHYAMDLDPTYSVKHGEMIILHPDVQQW